VGETYQQRYVRLHPERVAQNKANWYARNPDYTSEYSRKWRKENPERYLAISRASSQKAREEARDNVLMFFGDCCAKCGFSDRRALHLDHINGDGYLEAYSGRQRWTIVKVWKWIQQHPQEALEKYQILCANHNSIKAYEQSEWTRNKLVADRSVIQEGGASLTLNRTGEEVPNGRITCCN
jgi:hypothetical protein